MMRILQATALAIFLITPSARAQETKAFDYTPPALGLRIFGDAVNMLAQERDEYATNLSIHAANLVVEKKASAPSLESARRLLALAMQLSPRNRQAHVVNGQLRKGVLPGVKKGDYSPAVMSRLLLSRARLLAQGDNESEKLLARCFIEISAEMDPRNEDAVFAYEIQRLDTGDIDWDAITDPKKEPASSPPQE
jgi:hypothetical protein